MSILPSLTKDIGLGQSVAFDCLAIGQHVAGVKWERDGEELQFGNNTVIIIHVLIIIDTHLNALNLNGCIQYK